MMSKCEVCRRPTDLALCDMMTSDELHANATVPLVGVCDSRECTLKIMDRYELTHAISKDEPVKVVAGRHAGLVGTLYSTNTLGVSFVRPEPPDGSLRAVKTADVVRIGWGKRDA